MNPYVSIVIPCHNEAVNLREAVFNIVRYAEHELRSRYEILLVDNGSTDQTFAVARDLQATYRPVRACHIDARSKAEAVKLGMLFATGDYRYMCDRDLSAPINELTKFLKLAQDGWDLVIASREHPDSRVERSFKRWFIGRVFSFIVQEVTDLDYRDTQCGFKLFTARAANDIFPLVQCNSPAFDVEVLYLAYQLGFYCTEMPVTYHSNGETRMRLIRDSWDMFRDVLQIRKMHAGVVPSYKQKRIHA